VRNPSSPGKFCDRPESYNSLTFRVLKVVYFLRTKKRARFGVCIFLHFHTQPDPKQGIKKFLRHLPSTLVPSLTLQISDIVQSNFESQTLEFFAIICHVRDFNVWSSGKGKSNFVRLVMVRK
jgi:hypothetical protein